MTEEYSSLLKRQLKRSKIDVQESESIDKDRFLDFIHRVELAYTDFKEKNAQLLLAAEQSSNEIRDYITKLKAAEELNRKRQADILSMLENLQQGIFTVTEDGVVQGEYSSYLTKILETTAISERSIVDLLLNPCCIDSDCCDQILTAISCCVGADRFNFEGNQHVFPGEIQLHVNGVIKDIELEWVPILNADDLIEKIMITVRDLTQMNLLRKQHAAQKRELGMIHELLNLDHEKFMGFVSTSTEYTDRISQILKNNPTLNIDLAKQIYRYLHTIKGNARTYNLSGITNLVHEIEAVYREAISTSQALAVEPRLLELQDISETLHEYQRVAVEKLRFSNQEPGRTDPLFVKKIAEILGFLQSGQLSDRDALKHISRQMQSLSFVSMEDLLTDIDQSLPSIAQQIGKATPILKIESHGWHVAREIEGAMRDIFTHIIRNAIDHGIEPPVERRQQDKLENGEIKIELLQDAKMMRLTISDDGRGLQLQAIGDRATELGLITSSQRSEMTLSEQARLIFSSGLSTSQGRTTISGAGVGMDAILSFIQALGGDIEIKFQDAMLANEKTNIPSVLPFAFQIRLPLRYFLSTADDAQLTGSVHSVA